MTIDEIVLTAEEAIELEKLKEDFRNRINISPLKKALRAKEIKGYSLIFDEDKLPLPEKLSDNDEPLKGFSATEYCSMQLWLIREFWTHFIVEEYDIAEIDEIKPGSWYWNLNDFASEWLTNPRHYYSLAVINCKYLDWLRKFKSEGITNAELALIKVYEGEIIIKENTKLYQFWIKYSNKSNRIGTEVSDLKNKNKVKLFEKVIKNLDGDQKTQAEKDLRELKISIKDQGFVI